MKKKMISMTLAVMMGLSLAACGSGDSGSDKSGDSGTSTEDQTNQEDTSGDNAQDAGDNQDASNEGTSDEGASGDVANKDKPLVWFNRQPSNSSTGSVTLVQHYPKEIPVILFSLSILISFIADRQSVRFSSRVSVS